MTAFPKLNVSKTKELVIDPIRHGDHPGEPVKANGQSVEVVNSFVSVLPSILNCLSTNIWGAGIAQSVLTAADSRSTGPGFESRQER